MDRLKQLVEGWIDAEPGRNARRLADAAGVSRTTVYSLLGRSGQSRRMVERGTLEALAGGMGVHPNLLIEAARDDAGYWTDEIRTASSPRIRALQAALDELTEAEAEEVAEVAEVVLRRVLARRAAAGQLPLGGVPDPRTAGE
ncbi:hypothetical protein [Yinghuangia seranimata]|uniref:hypothetical protein n=1 Tax=Yinghuangia seranimata TaxID=408067 RepID=UPI00248C09C7|nr:hypothetical protein [Yinghuangia seranimata]MDI2127416.1 hypothetical protein [Yinghuangia seranimata]